MEERVDCNEQQIKDGKISQWSDYYDELKSRRYGVAAFFTEWVEL